MVKIIIDSTADFTLEEAEKKNLLMAPLQIIFGDEQYEDMYEISKEEFYEKLKTVDPKTSQPTPERFYKYYEEAKNNGDEVIVFTIASALSGTYQSAETAKSMIDYDKIYIVDSLCVALSLRILIDYACKLRDEGKSAKEIYDIVMPLREKVELRIIPETLNYLYRGGRLSKTTKIVGNLLGIKPIVGLEDSGKVGVFGKGRGLKSTIKVVINEMKELGVDENFPICVGYTTKDEYFEEVKAKALEEYQGFIFDEGQIGPVVGTHVGPKSAAIAYVRK